MIKCNLRVLMAERKLNIQDVANKTGLSRTTISALVNENGKGIQFDTLETLCYFLKIDPGELFRLERR
ncbi:helix-turn-helix domain-containing protein [Paenibacillus lautus]|uniref:helix-turn-helix domain-containing protein n=1 Tax=Paenibacillus lautus TaxID=1401 RepID=UPI00384E6413